MQLRVQLLNEDAKLPTLGHEGDLGYDVYSSEDVTMFPGNVYKVPTGIAVEARTNEIGTTFEEDGCVILEPHEARYSRPLGLIVKDRSSMAAKGVFTHGGVIDSGYRGEVVVLMTVLGHYAIKKGDKIAQLVPVPVLTRRVQEVDGFSGTSRGALGFGSTGA